MKSVIERMEEENTAENIELFRQFMLLPYEAQKRHSEATDWAKRWPACGKFNCDDENVCVIRRVIARQPPEEPIEGQMEL